MSYRRIKLVDIKPGLPVWYHANREYAYAAIVDSEPWQLGEHTWVVRLRDLPEEYAKTTTRGACHVPCAAVDALAHRRPPQPRKRLFCADCGIPISRKTGSAILTSKNRKHRVALCMACVRKHSPNAWDVLKREMDKRLGEAAP